MIKEISKRLSAHDRLNLAILLFIMSCCCFILFLIRMYFSDSSVFLFLNWNLFLAFLPWGLTTVITTSTSLNKNNFVLIFTVMAWLLFFPNAPYILTDLFHLRQRDDMPIWFDWILILSFSWTGLVFGFASLIDIEKIAESRLGKKWTGIATGALLFAASFGVYLGRFGRWNSWDLLSNPVSLMTDIHMRITDPFAHPRTWAITLLFGILLNFMYWTIRLLKKGAII